MVNPKKQQIVKSIVQKIQGSPIIGVINLENLPAAQFQVMRRSLQKTGVLISVARKRLLARALQESKKENVGELADKLRGMPALLFSSGNPFALYSTLQKSKSEASAKPGQIAPKDLMAKAGPTNFAPGPIISELASVGIKTKVEQGKLSIITDAVLVKEGEVISQKVSDTLKRLDIKPMEIGLNLVVAWENGFIFDAKHLHIDEAEYLQKIVAAARWAVNLALDAAYPTTETADLLLQKAFREAKTLALELEIITEATAGELVAKAERQAQALQEATGH